MLVVVVHATPPTVWSRERSLEHESSDSIVMECKMFRPQMGLSAAILVN